MKCYMHTDHANGRRKVWCINQTSTDCFEVFFGSYKSIGSHQTKMQHRTITKACALEVRDRIRQKLSKGYYQVDGYIDAERNFHLTTQADQRGKPSPDTTETVAQPVVEIDLSKLHNGQSNYF